MYTMLQSGHVSLYTPEDAYLSLWVFFLLGGLLWSFCVEYYFYICVFEKVGDVCGFLTCISEGGPF
jgi:hypothetical protein